MSRKVSSISAIEAAEKLLLSSSDGETDDNHSPLVLASQSESWKSQPDKHVCAFSYPIAFIDCFKKGPEFSDFLPVPLKCPDFLRRLFLASESLQGALVEIYEEHSLVEAWSKVMVQEIDNSFFDALFQICMSNGSESLVWHCFCFLVRPKVKSNAWLPNGDDIYQGLRRLGMNEPMGHILSTEFSPTNKFDVNARLKKVLLVVAVSYSREAAFNIALCHDQKNLNELFDSGLVCLKSLLLMTADTTMKYISDERIAALRALIVWLTWVRDKIGGTAPHRVQQIVEGIAESAGVCDLAIGRIALGIAEGTQPHAISSPFPRLCKIKDTITDMACAMTSWATAIGAEQESPPVPFPGSRFNIASAKSAISDPDAARMVHMFLVMFCNICLSSRMQRWVSSLDLSGNSEVTTAMDGNQIGSQEESYVGKREIILEESNKASENSSGRDDDDSDAEGRIRSDTSVSRESPSNTDDMNEETGFQRKKINETLTDENGPWIKRKKVNETTIKETQGACYTRGNEGKAKEEKPGSSGGDFAAIANPTDKAHELFLVADQIEKAFDFTEADRLVTSLRPNEERLHDIVWRLMTKILHWTDMQDHNSAKVGALHTLVTISFALSESLNMFQQVFSLKHDGRGMGLTGINPLKVSSNPLIDACHEVAARLKALKGQPMVDEILALVDGMHISD